MTFAFFKNIKCLLSGKMIITIEREKEKKVDLKKTIQRINMPPSPNGAAAHHFA